VESQIKLLTFIRLGLTSNEAKVYLTLFRLGTSTAKTISKHSGVARPDVYRVTKKLQKLGLVEKIISTPHKFRAISIHDAFAILMERRKKATSEVEATTREILNKFKNNNARTVLMENKTRFSLFSEQVAVRRQEKAFNTTERNFDMVTSWRNPHAVIFIDMEGIIEALQRGSEIRVIIDKPDEEKLLSDALKQLKKYSNFKIRYIINAPKAFISIYDKEKAWVCTCTDPVHKECLLYGQKTPVC
jgi:sugar-specific transcriptional regulator TrmB